MNAREAILSNKTALGIEFGSTRIKAVLVDEKNEPIASGGHEWENRYENGVWTYSLEDIWGGIRDCYQELVKDVQKKYDVELTSVGAMGISAMMHGYMPFNKEGELSCSLPYMEKQYYRRGKQCSYRAFQLQYSAEMEYCPSLPGNFE